MRLILITCLLAASLCATAFAEGGGTLRGTVSSMHTGKPIAGAVITAQSPAVFASTKTDSHGFFMLTFLPPGPVHIQVAAQAYTPEQFDVCVQDDTTRTLPLVMVPGGGIPTMIASWRHNVEAANGPNADITSDLYSIGQC